MRFTSASTNELHCVLPLKADYDVKDQTNIKHEKESTTAGDRERTTVYIPMLRENNTKYELLKFVEAFYNAAKTMGWRNNAERIYNKFSGQLEWCLRGSM